MVGPDGSEYEIPKEVQAKAFADGLRPTTYDLGDDAKLGDLAKSQGQVTLIRDGEPYMMPLDMVGQAVRDGFRVPDLADDRDRLLVAKAEASFDPRNRGVRGAVTAGLGKAASEFVKTATFGIVDPERDALTKEDRVAWEATKDANPIATGVGGVAGFGAGVYADPFAIGGTALRAGSAVERAAASKVGPIAGGIIGGAAEGALMSAPAATRALVEGDPEEAAEALLAGIGVGSLLGGAGRLFRMAKRAAGEKAGGALRSATEAPVPAIDADAGLKEAAPEAVDVFGISKAGRREATFLDRSTGAPIEAVDPISLPGDPTAKLGKALASKGTKVAEKVVGGTVGTVIGGPVGGLGGVVAAGQIGEALDTPRVQSLVSRAIKGTSKGLLRLGETLDSMTERAGPVTTVASLNALARLTGLDESTPKAQQFERARDELTKLHTDAEARADRISQMASAVGEARSDAFIEKAHGALDYLYTVLPKEPQRGGLFQKRAPWSPSDSQLASFERKVQVVMDPFSVIDELRKGTLTRDHIEALRAVYPALAFQLRDDILRKAADPKAPVLTKLQRTKLQLLLGQPIEDSSDPAAVALYQSFYAPADEPGRGHGPGSGVPGPKPRVIRLNADRLPEYMTEAQQIEAR